MDSNYVKGILKGDYILLDIPEEVTQLFFTVNQYTICTKAIYKAVFELNGQEIRKLSSNLNRNTSIVVSLIIVIRHCNTDQFLFDSYIIKLFDQVVPISDRILAIFGSTEQCIKLI